MTNTAWFLITRWRAYFQFTLNLIFIALTTNVINTHGGYLAPYLVWTLVGFAVMIAVSDLKQSFDISKND